MKKKHIIIGIVIFLIFETICITGYCMIKKHIEVGDYKYFCEEIQNDLQHQRFKSEYGEVILVSLDESHEYRRISGSNHLIPCIIQTISNEKYFVWVEFDTSTFSSSVQYDSITQISDEEE